MNSISNDYHTSTFISPKRRNSSSKSEWLPYKKSQIPLGAQERGGSAVFPKRVLAFGTSQKLRRRLIRTSSLNLPNIRRVVATLWALYAHRGQSPKLLLLFADHSDKLLRIMLNELCYLRRNLLSSRRLLVSTLRTGKNHRGILGLSLLRSQSCSTLWTKFHYFLLHCCWFFPLSLGTFKLLLVPISIEVTPLKC
jgi:hypothetical protein